MRTVSILVLYAVSALAYPQASSTTTPAGHSADPSIVSTASNAPSSTTTPQYLPLPQEPLAGAVVPSLNDGIDSEPDFPTPSANGSYSHVVLLSIDGMHQYDLQTYVSANPQSNFAALLANGIEFTNATTASPSDSFPGTASFVSGASPRTHGIYYDVAYSREYFAPGSNCTGPRGTVTTFDETIDLNNTVLNGGGGFNYSALPQELTTYGSCYNVMPNNFIQVNTIFEVAREAGYLTAYCDKHPAYQFVNGPSGLGLSESYFPEIASISGLAETEGYDALHWSAVQNWTNGNHYNGSTWKGNAPNLYGSNFQSVSVAQKTYGYTNNGSDFSANLTQALDFTDSEFGKLLSTLKSAGIYESTLIIVFAKHGQSPRNVGLKRLIDPNDLLNGAGVSVVGSSADDGAYLWLNSTADAATAKQNLLNNATALGIEQIWAGREEVTSIGFGDPSIDSRAPDVVIKTQVGVIYASTSATKVAEHGGINYDDVAVLLVAHNPNLSKASYGNHVSTRQIAATAVHALGLDPALLQGVQKESTQVLPMIF